MFNKYWREYPFFLQLLLLILMIFTMVSAAFVIGILLTPLISGYSAVELVSITEDSPTRLINASRLMQMLTNMPLFAGTAFLFAYASHPEPGTYLGFKKIKCGTNVFIAILMVLALLPFILQLAFWIKSLNPNTVPNKNEIVMKAYLHMTSPAEFLLNLIVFAIVPAFGEEMFFRGVLMRFIHKKTNNTLFAIFMSGGLFALFHQQPNNLLSIFIMGMMLGYIYYYTGSIWASMMAHFIHNALQVTIAYMEGVKLLPQGVSDMESFPLYIVLISAVAGIGMFLLLKKMATPLPEGWSTDFTEDELREQKEEEESNNYF